MCGRFVLDFTWSELFDLLSAEWTQTGVDLPGPSWNVAPTNNAVIVRTGEAKREAAIARWGLVPGWAKDLSIGTKMFNARSETAHEKPAFRSAFQRRRCVVPISGFYEWQKGEGGKQPWYVTRADEEPLLCAGLWELWTGAGDAAIESFSILTTAPNAFMEKLHDRMPCVLEREGVEAWLDPGETVNEARSMLRPAADGVLEGHPVSKRVGNVRNDDASLVEPVEELGGLF